MEMTIKTKQRVCVGGTETSIMIEINVTFFSLVEAFQNKFDDRKDFNDFFLFSLDHMDYDPTGNVTDKITDLEGLISDLKDRLSDLKGEEKKSSQKWEQTRKEDIESYNKTRGV